METISANDGDAESTPNGQVRYRLLGGALDRFVISDTTGDVTVAPDATFDFDQRQRYEMEV